MLDAENPVADSVSTTASQSEPDTNSAGASQSSGPAVQNFELGPAAGADNIGSDDSSIGGSGSGSFESGEIRLQEPAQTGNTSTQQTASSRANEPVTLPSELSPENESLLNQTLEPVSDVGSTFDLGPPADQPVSEVSNGTAIQTGGELEAERGQTNPGNVSTQLARNESANPLETVGESPPATTQTGISGGENSLGQSTASTNEIIDSFDGGNGGEISSDDGVFTTASFDGENTTQTIANQLPSNGSGGVDSSETPDDNGDLNTEFPSIEQNSVTSNSSSSFNADNLDIGRVNRLGDPELAPPAGESSFVGEKSSSELNANIKNNIVEDNYRAVENTFEEPAATSVNAGESFTDSNTNSLSTESSEAVGNSLGLTNPEGNAFGQTDPSGLVNGLEPGSSNSGGRGNSGNPVGSSNSGISNPPATNIDSSTPGQPSGSDNRVIGSQRSRLLGNPGVLDNPGASDVGTIKNLEGSSVQYDLGKELERDAATIEELLNRDISSNETSDLVNNEIPDPDLPGPATTESSTAQLPEVPEDFQILSLSESKYTSELGPESNATPEIPAMSDFKPIESNNKQVPQSNEQPATNDKNPDSIQKEQSPDANSENVPKETPKQEEPENQNEVRTPLNDLDQSAGVVIDSETRSSAVDNSTAIDRTEESRDATSIQKSTRLVIERAASLGAAAELPQLDSSIVESELAPASESVTTNQLVDSTRDVEFVEELQIAAPILQATETELPSSNKSSVVPDSLSGPLPARSEKTITESQGNDEPDALTTEVVTKPEIAAPLSERLLDEKAEVAITDKGKAKSNQGEVDAEKETAIRISSLIGNSAASKPADLRINSSSLFAVDSIQPQTNQSVNFFSSAVFDNFDNIRSARPQSDIANIGEQALSDANFNSIVDPIQVEVVDDRIPNRPFNSFLKYSSMIVSTDKVWSSINGEEDPVDLKDAFKELDELSEDDLKGVWHQVGNTIDGDLSRVSPGENSELNPEAPGVDLTEAIVTEPASVNQSSEVESTGPFNNSDNEQEVQSTTAMSWLVALFGLVSWRKSKVDKPKTEQNLRKPDRPQSDMNSSNAQSQED